jgi:hypothetical protein
LRNSKRVDKNRQLLKDIKVELDDEFDRNFERKAFFITAWQAEETIRT